MKSYHWFSYQMVILLIGNYLSGSGHNQNAWHDIAFHLQKAGYGVITTSSEVNKISRFVDMLTTIWSCRNDYHVAQIDVFSGQAFLYAECCSRLLYRLGKPFFLTLHGGNLPGFAGGNPKRVRALLGMARKVITPSRYLLEKMAPYRSDLVMIPNPLEVSRYSFRARVKPEPKIVWLRAFHQIYNPALAPLVVRNLVSEFPNTRLLMVGPDKGDGSRQKTELVVKENGLQNYVEFFGAIPKQQVPITLNRGDIFVNTTNIDNTPVSVLEAMACGLCVVSTNVGGLPYLIDNGNTGLLVPPENPEAMSNAIMRILTDPILAEKLSIKGHAMVEQFDWDIILPKWNALLEGISTP